MLRLYGPVGLQLLPSSIKRLHTGKQTNGQIAQIFGWYEILGLGIEFDAQFQQDVTCVTAAEAQKAACRYLLKPYVSLVGPESAINHLDTLASI